MKCINKLWKGTICIVLSCVLVTGCAQMNSLFSAQEVVAAYEEENYNKNIYEGSLFTDNICVATQDVELNGFQLNTEPHAAGLFDLKNSKVDYAYKIHERLYPASTTKIMTALVALKYGNLSDVVTVSQNAVTFAPDEQVCGLKAGDRLTLEDLIYGLLLYSGNDNATAIAEHVGGSMEAFAAMMNEEAKKLMANESHFMNSSGLHNTNHYTTAYDLYLIFNECIKNDKFLEIIKTPSYTARITGADGAVRQDTWHQSNFYAMGEAQLPASASIVGGKTGTTKEAGNCLILLVNDASGNPYISVVMGADTKELLYTNMTALINAIPNSE